MLAGDLYNLGLGKVILFRYNNQKTGKTEMRFGILSDSGGAFVDNLFQVDMFTGLFDNRDVFFKETNNYPTYAQAFFAIKNEEDSSNEIKPSSTSFNVRAYPKSN